MEDVPEVCVTIIADHFCPAHAVTVIMHFFDCTRSRRLEVAWPAGAGVEFFAGTEERSVAHDAVVHSLVVMVPEHSAEGRLGPFFLRDIVLLRGQM